MLPSPLTHYIALEVPPLFYSSPCERALLLSHPYGGTAQTCCHVQGLTVHRRSSLDGASCYSPSNSPLTFLCSDFKENKLWVRGEHCLSARGCCLPAFSGTPRCSLAPAHLGAMASALLGGLLSSALAQLPYTQITIMFLMGCLG